MYIPNKEALFGAMDFTAPTDSSPVSVWNVKTAKIAQDNAFFCAVVAETRALYQDCQWWALPERVISYPESPSDPDSRFGVVRGIFGRVPDGPHVVMDTVLLPTGIVQRAMQQYDSDGVIKTRQISGAPTDLHMATVDINVLATADITKFRYLHREHAFDTDLTGVRCHAAVQFVLSGLRLQKLQSDNAHKAMIEGEHQTLARWRAKLTALCSNAPPPMPSEPEWPKRIAAYIGNFGVAQHMFLSFLRGKRPMEVGVTLTFDVEGECRPGSATPDSTAWEYNAGPMRTHFPAPPSTHAGRVAYATELGQVMTLAKSTLATLPELEIVARAFNRRVHFP